MTEFRRGGEPIVWLVQSSWFPNADLSSAQRYGKLVPILDATDSPSAAPGPCMRKITNALQDYRPGDYIVYALADPAGLLLTGIVLERLRITAQPISWLRWERERAPSGERRHGVGYFVPSNINT